MTLAEFISSWVKDIVLLFVIITLVDLVMPKGSMRRYINFVVGFLIIFTVINPFVNLTKIDFKLDREVFKNSQVFYDLDEGLFRQQEEQIEELYKDKVAVEIRSFLEDSTDYRVAEIHLDINRDEDNYGSLAYLSILIDEGDKDAREGQGEIKISPVVLEEYRRWEGSRDEFLDLKEVVAERYKIHMDLIDISTIGLED